MPFVNHCGLFTACVPLWALYYLFKFAILPLAKHLQVTHQMPFANCWHAAGCLPQMPCHQPFAAFMLHDNHPNHSLCHPLGPHGKHCGIIIPNLGVPRLTHHVIDS